MWNYIFKQLKRKETHRWQVLLATNLVCSSVTWPSPITRPIPGWVRLTFPRVAQVIFSTLFTQTPLEFHSIPGKERHNSRASLQHSRSTLFLQTNKFTKKRYYKKVYVPTDKNYIIYCPIISHLFAQLFALHCTIKSLHIPINTTPQTWQFQLLFQLPTKSKLFFLQKEKSVCSPWDLILDKRAWNLILRCFQLPIL